MKHSVVWFYQEVARRIGAERMQAHLDALGYGNRDISGGIDKFWLTGGLRISPHEQIDFPAAAPRRRAPLLRAEPGHREADPRAGARRRPTRCAARRGWRWTSDRAPAGWSATSSAGQTPTSSRPCSSAQSSDGERIMPLRRSLTRALLKRHGALPERRLTPASRPAPAPSPMPPALRSGATAPRR